VGLAWAARNACEKKERCWSALAQETCTPSSVASIPSGAMDAGILEVRCNFCWVEGWMQDGHVHASLSQR
jgi:hypothetical protein